MGPGQESIKYKKKTLCKTAEKKKKEMKKQAIANFFALHTNAKKDILLRLLITISQL